MMAETVLQRIQRIVTARVEDRSTSLRSAAVAARLQAFEPSQREAAVGGDGSMTVQRELDKKVDRVAEIDGLRKGSAVADRLAALKAGKAPEDAAGQAG